MGSEQLVNMIFPKSTISWIPIDRTYKMSFTGRWSWFTKLLWRTLERMGCCEPHLEEREVVTQICIDTRQLTIKVIHECVELIHSLRGHWEIECVLIGRQKFIEWKIADIPPYSCFCLQLTRVSGYEFLNGIPIRVIPWMDGILFAPKER